MQAGIGIGVLQVSYSKYICMLEVQPSHCHAVLRLSYASMSVQLLQPFSDSCTVTIIYAGPRHGHAEAAAGWRQQNLLLCAPVLQGALVTHHRSRATALRMCKNMLLICLTIFVMSWLSLHCCAGLTACLPPRHLGSQYVRSWLDCTNLICSERT